MFNYTNSSNEPPQRQTTPKTRMMSSSIPKPNTCSERPRSSQKGASQDKTICERYTNRTYNRLPSPRGRFQTIVSMVKEPQPPAGDKPSTVKEQQSKPPGRGQPPVPPPRSLLMKRSYSDVGSKRRPLDLECNKNSVQAEVELKARPKTTNSSRTSHSLRSESPLEYKVLHTVQNVLSRALLQQGKIDETNIKNVLDRMRDSLYMDRNDDDEELSEVEVELKPSRTTVNEINLGEEHFGEKKSKVVTGIVRREQSGTVPERKTYRKIYDSMDSSSSNKHVPEGDEKMFVCVDVPDLVFPHFPSSKKDDEKRMQEPGQKTASKHTQAETVKQEGILNQFEVGDSQTKDNPFWSPSEDAKLKEYIESLIHNMKNQVNCGSVLETEGEIDSHGTVCRSFCVCKVCVSKKSQSKTNSKQQMAETERHSVDTEEKPNVEKPKEENPKEQNSTVQRTTNERTKPPIPRGAGNRLRLLRPSPKAANADSPCKVIRNTNPNFQPESKLNTSLNLKKNTSYTVVDTGNHSEEHEDMYLQRRMRKPPSRRPSAKMN